MIDEPCILTLKHSGRSAAIFRLCQRRRGCAARIRPACTTSDGATARRSWAACRTRTRAPTTPTRCWIRQATTRSSCAASQATAGRQLHVAIIAGPGFGSGKRMAFNKPLNACSSGHWACTMSRSDQIPHSGLLEGRCTEITVRLRPNIWPGKALPELEPAFKELGRLMMDVGLRLTEHCDRYMAQHGSPAQPGTLQQILLRSPCPKASSLVGRSAALPCLGTGGLCMPATPCRLNRYTLLLQGRLLHYFPSGGGTGTCSGDWCAWHQDHGSITGQRLHVDGHSVWSCKVTQGSASKQAVLQSSCWLYTTTCRCGHRQ